MEDNIISQKNEYILTDNLIDVNENDFLSSDDSVNEECKVDRPKKYNQLKPKANLIFKLLQSLKSKDGSIWKTVNFPNNVEIWNSFKLNGDIYRGLPVKMGKRSNKRKREEMSSDEDASQNIKKAYKRDADALTNKNIDRKEKSHSISSSDEEIENAPKYKQKHKKSNEESIHNGQISSSDSHSEQENVKQSKKLNEDIKAQVNGISNEHYSSDCYQPSDSEAGQNKHRKENRSSKKVLSNKTSSQSQNKKNIQEKIYREHSFTAEDEEEILNFSELLSEKTIEKNNIWILQCPTTMDCSSLTNQYLDLSGNCFLDDGETTFEAYSHREAQKSVVTLAIPSEHNHFKLSRIPITGNITVEKSVKIENDIDFNIPDQPEFVDLPGNLRKRHPLLGKDYKNQPITAARTENIVKKEKHLKKLDQGLNGLTTEDSLTDSTERKKKKKKSNKELDSRLMTEDSLTDSTERKKKKKKSNKELDSSFRKISHLGEFYEEQKVRRKKKNKHHDDGDS